MTNPSVEKQRLAAIERLGIMDSPPEERFERLTRIARDYYGVKSALFSIIDAERQWFKAHPGLDVDSTPRDISFCDHTIRDNRALVVEDACADPRFCDNPLVVGEPHIRFYAGIPVREPTGFKIGSLCLVDDKPRVFSELDLDMLRSLALMVEEELERTYMADDNCEYVRNADLSRAIQRAQNVFLTSDNERNAFEQMLGDLLALTGSQFGFIGEVLHRRPNQPYLKIGAISNIAWNPETQALFQQVERRGMIFNRLDNILGAPMVTGEVIISHDVSGDPRGGGLPPGHPEIHDYIGIPVLSGSRQIGLIGLGNRPGGYTEKLAEELAPLLQTLGYLIERNWLYQEKKQHRKNLEQAANYDALTGLPNRRRLTQLFQEELCQADNRGGSVSVCFIDLDGFKEINDEHGHAVGDTVLKVIAQRLQATVRSNDVVARLGGDEFVAILRDVGDATAYDRLLEAIRIPVKHQRLILQSSASMGVTVYPDDDSDSDLLLRHADQAMYASKEYGKNCYKVFDLDSHQSRKEQVRVLEQISDALADGQLELYYQPKIGYRRGRVEGFEALIRWNHPEDGLLSPAEFIDHIEYTEYARQVGLFVLHTGIGVIEQFINLGLPYTLSINLSPSHFLGGLFKADLEDALADRHPEVKSRLILEILETTAMDDANTVIDNINACHAMGIDISLDDFGTGYSSLSYFRQLQVQEIKIDRSFVQDMLKDGDDPMVVQAILGLSQSFKRRTVAEGVETAELEAWLIGAGCEIGQGYHYSRPLPLGDALAWADSFSWIDQRGTA